MGDGALPAPPHLELKNQVSISDEYDLKRKLTGIYTQGRGVSTAFGSWRDDVVSTYLGAPAVAGSFNVVLDEPVEFIPQERVADLNGKRAIWPATVFGHRCLVERWRECPLHIVEFISSVPLKDFLEPENRTVEVEFPFTQPVPAWKKLIWSQVWCRDAVNYYSDDDWTRINGNFRLRKLARLARQSGLKGTVRGNLSKE